MQIYQLTIIDIYNMTTVITVAQINKTKKVSPSMSFTIVPPSFLHAYNILKMLFK